MNNNILALGTNKMADSFNIPNNRQTQRIGPWKFHVKCFFNIGWSSHVQCLWPTVGTVGTSLFTISPGPFSLQDNKILPEKMHSDLELDDGTLHVLWINTHTHIHTYIWTH